MMTEAMSMHEKGYNDVLHQSCDSRVGIIMMSSFLLNIVRDKYALLIQNVSKGQKIM